MKIRIFSFMLALALVFNTLPMSVYAETQTAEMSLAETRTEEVQPGETQTEEELSSEMQIEEALTEEVQTGEAQTEEMQIGEVPTEEEQSSEAPTEETQTGEEQSSEAPTEETQTEEEQSGEAPTEETQTGEVPTEEEQSSEAQPEETQIGEEQSSEAPAEETQTEEEQSSEAPTEETQTEEETAEETEEETEEMLEGMEDTTQSIFCTVSPESNVKVKYNGSDDELVTLTAEFSYENLTEEDITYQWYCDPLDGDVKPVEGAAETSLVVPNDTEGVFSYYCVASAEEYSISEQSGSAAVAVTDAEHVRWSQLDLCYSETADKLEEEGWKWDKDTLTLTLQDTCIVVRGNQDAVILPEGAKTLNVEGNCDIFSGSYYNTAAIKSNKGTLEIQGAGNLDLIGYNGITNYYADLTIACDVDMTVSNAGMDATGDVVITDGAQVNIGNGSYGIYNYNTQINVLVEQNSELCLDADSYSMYGVWFEYITFAENSAVKISRDLYMPNGYLTVSGGSQMILLDEASASAEVISVLAEDAGTVVELDHVDAEEDITIRDSAEVRIGIDSPGTEAAIVTDGAILIEGAALQAASANSSMFKAASFTAKNCSIEEPEGGSIEVSGTDVKVLDADGNTANSVSIVPSSDPYLLITDQSDNIVYGSVENPPKLYVVCESYNPSVQDQGMSYQWYQCDENGENRQVIDGAVTAEYIPEGTAGISRYICVVSSEGMESAESTIVTAVIPYAGKTALTSSLDLQNLETVDNLETEGWSWDAETKTLVLDNFLIYITKSQGAVYFPEDSVVVLKNESIIHNDYVNSNTLNSGLHADGELTIYGEGSCRIKSLDGYAIYCNGNLTVEETGLDLEGKNWAISTGGNCFSTGCQIIDPKTGTVISASDMWRYKSVLFERIETPYLKVTEPQEIVYSSHIGACPVITMAAEAKNVEAAPVISYAWYSCDSEGQNRQLISSKASFTAKAEIGCSYYVGAASAEGMETVETKVITVMLAHKNMSVVTGYKYLVNAETVDKLAEEGWSWDAENKVLTLKNFTGILLDQLSCFSLPADSQIVVNGENYIQTESTSTDIDYSGTLDISGSGSLKIGRLYGTDLVIRGITLVTERLYTAFSQDNGISILEGADVTVTDWGIELAGTVLIDDSKVTFEEGVYRCLYNVGEVSISNGSEVTAEDVQYVSAKTVNMDASSLLLSGTNLSVNNWSLSNGAAAEIGNNTTIRMTTLSLGSGCSLICDVKEDNSAALNVSGTAEVKGSLTAISRQGTYALYAAQLELGENCRIVKPENGYYDTADGYIKDENGDAAAEIQILEGEAAATITAVGDITGDMHAGGKLTAGEVTPKNSTVSYEWQSYSSNEWSAIEGGTERTLDMTELDYPSFYVGRQIRVKVSGVGLYDGVVYSNTVAIQDDPAKLKNVIINQEAQSFSTDMTFIALDIGYGDIPAEFIFEPNDVNAVITIDGKEGNSCILENPADQQQLVVAVTYGGVTNTYYFTLNVETVPESGKLTLDLSNISGITDADVLTADWTAPDGSTGQLTADSTSLTVSADVPYESEVRVYTRHQEAGSEYPDIFQVHLSNDDSDKYDYELPEIKDGNVCGCESCGNAYEFVMDKGDVTYYLENDCYAFPAPKITADWAADGTAVFTVTLPGTESKLPVDTHNTDRYQRIALRLTDENGKYRQDSVFEESAKNYIYLEPENDGDPLSVTSVTIAADNVDPEQDYYVQAYYIPDLRDCPDKYIQSTVKLEARGKIALEPVTFGKTLVDGQYMDLYSNGIITLPMQKNTVTQLDLSFGGNSKYLDKMSCTVENDREDVVTASYVLDGEQPRLVFTPLKTGTAYLTLKASLFDQAVTVIWRVNVVANTVVLKPGLKSKTVTVNPAKTDYTAIQMRTAIHDYSNSLSWEFVGNQREILNKCFDLVQIDSQTLEIRPDWEGINQIGGMNKLASSYKVQLCVRSGETGSYAYTSEFLTMKIDKKLPTVKAGKAKLNSFYSNAETVLNLTASAGRVTKVTIDESKANAKGNVYGSWADIFWDEESGTASVIASKRNFKASGKLYLKVYLEGYSEHTPVSVAVSVSAASTAPKLKLSSSSITMAETGSSFLMQVLSGNGKISLEETGFTKIRLATSYEIAAMSEKERAAYAITTDYIIYQYASLEPNEFILHCNATAKPGKILLYAVIGDDEQQMVPLVLTVKTAKTSTVKFNKKSVVLNSSLGDGSDVQTVRIITSCVNLTIGKEMLSVKDSTGADASDRLQVEFDFQEKSLEISTLENCPDGTYQIELAVPGVKKTAVTKVKVQSTAPVFKLSKTKVTINSLKNEVTEILLTPKTAGYEELESGKINLVLKKNGLILAEETAENGISQDGLKISYSNYISYVSGNQGFRLQTTAALSGVYTLEISYTCPDGSESKPVKLTINVQAPMPTVKPAYTSMTIQEDRVSTQFDLAYTISAKNLYRGSVRYALEDEEGNVVRTSSSSYEDKESGTGYCRFTLTDLQAGENWKLKLWYYADGFTGKEAVVKIKGTTADPTVNISMKGNLDLSKENGGLVTITPKYANYAQQPTFTVKFDVYAKEGGQPITGSSAYVGTGGKLVFSKWFKAELNRYTGTYTLTINQDEGSAYAENLWSAGYTYTIKPYIMINGLSYYGKEMKLNVKQSTLKVTQSAKEVVLCSSDQYDREYIRLTLNDVNAAAIRDVQVAAGSAAGYDVVYYENGLCAIRFLDDTPAAKGGKLKLNIFVDGVSDSGAKVKANAAAQVTVKLVTAE